MAHLEAKPGRLWTEQKIALDRKLKPCGFFDPDVWYRGVIDYNRMHEHRALIVDYKTGKPHNKHKQLMTFALWCFLSDPLLQLVQAKYYWTTTFNTTQKVWSRDDMPTMWGELLPDLRQYVEAFKTDTWQPRQSGLCHGWCQVKDCEFWKPKRAR